MNRIKWPFGNAAPSGQKKSDAEIWADTYCEGMIEKIKNEYEKLKELANANPAPLKDCSDKSIVDFFLKKFAIIDTNGSWNDENLRVLLRGTREELTEKKVYQPYFDYMIQVCTAIDICAESFKSDKNLFSDLNKLNNYLSNSSQKEMKALEEILRYNNDYYIQTYYNTHKNKHDTRDFRNALYKTFREPMAMIFKYDEWIKTYRGELVEHISIVKCPYCDRNFIANTANENGKIVTTADLDHYHIKSDFPLFALSLFNLIPSCHTCNSTFKGADRLQTTYPYQIGYGDLVCFRTSATTEQKLKLIDGDQEAEFEIYLGFSPDIAPDLMELVKGDIEVFQLEKVYKLHKNLVRELYLRRKLYGSGDYLKTVETLLQKTGLQNDLDWFLYGCRVDDDGQDNENPLGKLRCDIVNEIKKNMCY